MRETPNTFVRALIVGLVLALCCLSYINFFWREPQFEISAGLLSLIALIVLLSLSEIYDHLSFGAILTLKRKVEEERASKESLREDNRELRSHLVTLVANIQQSQVNNTFNAPPEVWGKLLGVVPASEPLAKEEEAPIPSAAVTQEDSSDTIRQSSRQRFERQRAAEAVAIRKYLDSIQAPHSERLLNAEFSSSFQNIDPVMDRRIVFDGYVKAEARERFIEAIRARAPSGTMYVDRLYVMLTKIWLYRQAKKVQAELILLLVDAEGDDSEDRPRSNNRLIEYFQPAIANDLLRIESITVSASEIELEMPASQRSA